MKNSIKTYIPEDNLNNKVIACDSSAIYLFSDIYNLMISGATFDTIRKKIMHSKSSVVEDYFRGAVGLLILAVEKKVKLVIDPVCLKELCIDGNKDHRRFTSLLFKRGIIDLIWPIDPHACTEKVRKRICEYRRGVGALRRKEKYSKTNRCYVDRDLEDKMSCSQIDYMFEQGGYLINLYCPKDIPLKGHDLDEIKDCLIEQYNADSKKTNNLAPNMRKTIEPKTGDKMLLPRQICLHVHRNNQDLGDEVTQTNLFNQINNVSKVRVYSLGDAYRKSEAVQQAYESFASKRVEVRPVVPPYSVEPLIRRMIGLNNEAEREFDRPFIDSTWDEDVTDTKETTDAIDDYFDEFADDIKKD